jgi:hypothetical protein
MPDRATTNRISVPSGPRVCGFLVVSALNRLSLPVISGLLSGVRHRSFAWTSTTAKPSCPPRQGGPSHDHAGHRDRRHHDDNAPYHGGQAGRGGRHRPGGGRLRGGRPAGAGACQGPRHDHTEPRDHRRHAPRHAGQAGGGGRDRRGGGRVRGGRPGKSGAHHRSRRRAAGHRGRPVAARAGGPEPGGE